MKNIILFITCLSLLTGCWDRTELKELGIVLGIAIDKDPETGEYILTSQMLKPSSLDAQSSSSAPPYEKIVTSGKTIHEALRKANLEFDRKGFFAHNKVILIDEEVAKEGMFAVLDSFKRGKQVRGFVYICIAKGSQARKILESTTSGIETQPAIHLKNMNENTNIQFTAAKIDLLNFYKQSLGSGINPVGGVFEFEKDKNVSKKHVKLSGGAVFSKDKLVGFLNEKETRGYLLGKGKVDSGALSIPSPIDEERFVSVEVKKASAKITPHIKGDHISFTISVTGEGIIVEQQSTGTIKNRTEQLQYMKKIEDKIKQLMEDEINMAIEKAQKQYKADIFGFGSTLNKKNPKTWNKVKKDWNEHYPEVPYTVNVKFSINMSGVMQGLFQPEN
jgi:spore germination protein KC